MCSSSVCTGHGIVSVSKGHDNLMDGPFRSCRMSTSVNIFAVVAVSSAFALKLPNHIFSPTLISNNVGCWLTTPNRSLNHFTSTSPESQPLTTNPYLSLGRFPQSLDEPDNGAFPTSGSANESDDFAGLDSVEVLKNGLGRSGGVWEWYIEGIR